MPDPQDERLFRLGKSSDVAGRFGASTYQALLEQGNPRVDAVRSLLEEWYVRYAVGNRDARHALRRAFETGQKSAFFELFVHELLHRMSYVVVVEAMVGTEGKCPDFLATAPDGTRLVVEAVEAWEAGQQPIAARRSRLLDLIDDFDDPHVAILIEGAEDWPTAPPKKAIHAFLRRRIAETDPEHLRASVAEGGLRALPRWRFPESHVDFVPVPKKEGMDRGLVGLFPSGMRDVDWHTPICEALTRKASRYGELGLPFVVALDLAAFMIPDLVIREALFGRTVTRIPQRGDETLPSYEVRLDDGAWTMPGRSARTRVSAVWSFKDAHPFRVGATKMRLWENPWAAHRVDGPIRRLPQAAVTNWTIEEVEGASDGDLLALPDDWAGLP